MDTTTPPQPGSNTPLKPSLAARMKFYEAPYNTTLTPNHPVILRLDGHAFSRFTSHFARPFDQRIHAAMISTCSALLSFFPSATVAYTQSDEITLVFPNGVGAFNERVQKLCSLAASYCSVHFVKNLMATLETQPESGVVDKEVVWTAHFDARIFAVPSVEEALNNLIWRCRNDAVRNAVSSFARTMYTTKEMHGLKASELIEKMKEEKGIVFEDAVPKWAIEGCLVKREQFEHRGLNMKTGVMEKTMRTRARVEERGVREFSEENLKLVSEKYW
jgi:tRNA(His) guanylyltransferase